jgi:hypothetical protein
VSRGLWFGSSRYDARMAAKDVIRRLLDLCDLSNAESFDAKLGWGEASCDVGTD